MPRRRNQCTRSLVLLAALALAGPALLASDAAAATPQEPAERVSPARADETSTNLKRGLMSPFCPGRTLSGCSSSRAAQWRIEIDGWAQQGLSEPEITARLQARVPDFTLTGTPRGHWRWSIATIAVAIATLGLAIYVVRARRSTARDDSALFVETAAAAAAHVAFEGGPDGPDDLQEDRLDDLLDEELAASD